MREGGGREECGRRHEGEGGRVGDEKHSGREGGWKIGERGLERRGKMEAHLPPRPNPNPTPPHAVQAHDDLKTKADLLLLECIDHALIGEGVLHYVSHLRGSFLKPDCRLIPAAGVMKGMLVQLRTGELHGVDMTMCDAYRWHKEVRAIELRREEYTQLTQVFDIFVFDFAEASPSQQVENMEIVISRDGIVSALVIWFDLILDEEIVVSTSPFGPADRTLGLGQGIVYLQPSEAKVKRGATLPLVAANNGVELAFTIDEDKMTRKSQVAHPSFHLSLSPSPPASSLPSSLSPSLLPLSLPPSGNDGFSMGLPSCCTAA